MLYWSSISATPSNSTQLSGRLSLTTSSLRLKPHLCRRVGLRKSFFLEADLGVPGWEGTRYLEAMVAAEGSLEKLKDRCKGVKNMLLPSTYVALELALVSYQQQF